MNKIIIVAIVFNILLALAFIYSNFTLWDSVNADYPSIIASHWGPFSINAPHYYYVERNLSAAQGIFLYFNSPFWLFWLVMIVNLFFMFMLARSKEKS